ncbi:MarR family winged helix-turn-helix transcriptional regulator [Camelimonas fluminis]|uniref:MarR family winged helix-turn-helix transcriptional regulator n=1 Tax=Camelimonas fluminis TaxID=1576911 RepID=A0ABV7UJJ5_9HYPH|nr:MarR family transcriptional regulator [Camelimonas fluminis]
MTSSENVQNTHDGHTLTSGRLRQLHEAVLDIVAVMNRPQRDAFMVRTAGIALDRALFPLLVLVGKFGPIGVVELADRNGRDHTTVSRQVGRLVELGLVERQVNEHDRRIREVILTDRGRAMTDRIDEARESLMRAALGDWSDEELGQLATFMRRYADAILGIPDHHNAGDQQNRQFTR